MKRNDWIIIAAGLILALGVYIGLQINQSLNKDGVKSVEIYVDGQLVETLPLAEDTVKRYETDYGVNTVEVLDGVARIIFADCVTQSCIRDGDIDQVNETIICLPNHFHLKVVGKGGVDIDAISE